MIEVSLFLLITYLRNNIIEKIGNCLLWKSISRIEGVEGSVCTSKSMLAK